MNVEDEEDDFLATMSREAGVDSGLATFVVGSYHAADAAGTPACRDYMGELSQAI